MSAVLTNKIQLLRDRSEMLRHARDFFHQRGLIEVDVPMLAPTAPVDPYIDLVTASCMGRPAYLHSSPEYGMKRLLSLGVGDCYQIGHVFRDGELGERHNPEFTMVEWYRIGDDFQSLIDETTYFIQLFIGPQDISVFDYEELFWHMIGYFPETIEERDECFANQIEPFLQNLTVVRHYPPEQAMLAKTEIIGDMKIAKRFEVYFRGIELANGYQELADLPELKKRLIENNHKRSELGKETYPVDKAFLSSLIPECCGVAVGFDRLMMLRHECAHIKEILSLSWQEI